VLNDVSDGQHNGYYGYNDGYYSNEEK